jgi:hypothetical protein
LTLANTENLTAGRALTIKVNDAARTLDLAGNLTLAAAFSTSGANALTLTTTGSTNVTLPTSGTLLTTTGSGAGLSGIPLSVSNADGTLTISPTTGAVVASLNLGNANTWTGVQTFGAGKLAPADLTFSGGSLLNGATANVLEQRNGATAQTLRVYSKFTDASNYSRLSFVTADNATTTISTEAAGTGGLSVLKFICGTSNAFLTLSAGGMTIGQGSTSTWNFTQTGNLNAVTDNSFDIGAAAANRPRTGYFGTGVISPVFKTTTALITAVDGSSNPSFLTNSIAATGGPTTATQNGWLKMQDSAGNTVWVPVWK